MQKESRVKKTVLNAKVNMICYFASFITAFFTCKILLDNLGAERILFNNENPAIRFFALIARGVIKVF